MKASLLRDKGQPRDSNAKQNMVIAQCASQVIQSCKCAEARGRGGELVFNREESIYVESGTIQMMKWYALNARSFETMAADDINAPQLPEACWLACTMAKLIQNPALYTELTNTVKPMSWATLRHAMSMEKVSRSVLCVPEEQKSPWEVQGRLLLSLRGSDKKEILAYVHTLAYWSATLASFAKKSQWGNKQLFPPTHQLVQQVHLMLDKALNDSYPATFGSSGRTRIILAHLPVDAVHIYHRLKPGLAGTDTAARLLQMNYEAENKADEKEVSDIVYLSELESSMVEVRRKKMPDYILDMWLMTMWEYMFNQNAPRIDNAWGFFLFDWASMSRSMCRRQTPDGNFTQVAAFPTVYHVGHMRWMVINGHKGAYLCEGAAHAIVTWMKLAYGKQMGKGKVPCPIPDFSKISKEPPKLPFDT